MRRKLSPPHEVMRFGLDIPPHPGVAEIPGMYRHAGAHIQVQRIASIERANGLYRIIEVKTIRDLVNIYVSPTGRLRIFTDGKEWKRGA